MRGGAKKREPFWFGLQGLCFLPSGTMFYLLPMGREAKWLEFSSSHVFSPVIGKARSPCVPVLKELIFFSVVYKTSPCLAGTGGNWSLGNISVFSFFPQICLRGTSANRCRQFCSSISPFWLTVGVGQGVAPRSLLNICTAEAESLYFIPNDVMTFWAPRSQYISKAPGPSQYSWQTNFTHSPFPGNLA